MKLSNEDILFASLLESKVVQQAPRIAVIENEISKHVMLPINIIPIHNKENTLYAGKQYDDVETWMSDKKKSAIDQFFPLSIKSRADKNVWYTLPWEPLISVDSNVRLSSKTVASATKRYVGTMKNGWAMDDYNITITGVFYGEKMRGSVAQCYPRKDMEKLRDYLLTPEALDVHCELLQIFGIDKIVIYSVDFPFTKGEYVQAYEIKAKSDFPWSLEYNPKKKNTLEVGNPEGEFIRTD